MTDARQPVPDGEYTDGPGVPDDVRSTLEAALTIYHLMSVAQGGSQADAVAAARQWLDSQPTRKQNANAEPLDIPRGRATL